MALSDISMSRCVDKESLRPSSVSTATKLPTPPPALRSINEYSPSQHSQLSMIGKIPFTAYSLDNRFSSSHYMPIGYHSLHSLRLVVLVHSSDRDAAELRNAFIAFAETNGCALLAPLFPQGIIDPEEHDNYKTIEYRGIRFDKILLGMMEEVSQRWPKVDSQRVFMSGFSGGGQFVHRFAYLHPDRLEALAIGGPGSITALDTKHDYPRGVRDIEKVFGVKWKPEALRRIRVLMLVGDLDTSVARLVARGMKLSNCKNRCEILAILEKSWRSFGIQTKLQLVPGVRHEGSKMNSWVEDFFTTELTCARAP